MSHVTWWVIFHHLNYKSYSKNLRTQIQNIKSIYLLQIGVALFYYRLGQTLLQIRAFLLLQIGTIFVTN